MNFGEGDAQIVEFSPAFLYQGAFFFLTNQQGSCWNQYNVLDRLALPEQACDVFRPGGISAKYAVLSAGP